MAYYERGLADRADTHFRMARKIDPKTVVPELSMAKHWCARRDFQQASVAYEAAISRNPKSARALNDFAWFLATCPDDKLRDGTRAAELIQSVLRSTDVRDPNFLDTWAAALAEQRDFEQAASVAAQAMEMARETRMFRLAGEIAARKELFDRKVPYRLPANGEQRD
jgi:Tfp pilus assembly protein PilF